MTTEPPRRMSLDPCAFWRQEPCCDPLDVADHHQDAEPDCTCDRKHHALRLGERCGYDEAEHVLLGHDYQGPVEEAPVG